MTTQIIPGQMTIIDDTVDPPVIVFDSDEKLLHFTNGPIDGAITLPARTATIFNGNAGSRSDVNVNANYALAAIDPSANIVLGGFRVTTFGGSQGVAGLGVFDAGGSYVHVQDGDTLSSTPNTPFRGQVTTMAAYTFFASGGVLYLNERCFVSVSPNSLNLTVSRTLLSIRFDFKLYAGTLT